MQDFGDDVLTIRQDRRNAHGDLLPADPDDDVTVDGCYAQVLAATSPSSTEAEDRRGHVVTLYRIFAPGAPPITATSRVKVNGGRWLEVVGEPNRWHLPDGTPTHVEIQARETTG